MSIQQHFDLPSFNAVELSAGVRAEVGAGIAQSVHAEAADAEALDRLQLEVRGRTLYVSLRQGFFGLFPWGHAPIIVSITAPDIAGVATSAGASAHFVGCPSSQLVLESSGGSQLLAEAVDVEWLRAAASSGSKLTVVGRSMFADLASSSGSSLDAEGLDCGQAEVASSSGSRITLSARDAAKVAASSGSSIRLRARPAELHQHSDGGGSIRVG